jgi:hypothetical protein
MWTKEDIIIALVLAVLFGAIITLLVRAIYPNRVVIDEPYEQRDTPESRYRKASGEEV